MASSQIFSEALQCSLKGKAVSVDFTHADKGFLLDVPQRNLVMQCGKHDALRALNE